MPPALPSGLPDLLATVQDVADTAATVAESAMPATPSSAAVVEVVSSVSAAPTIDDDTDMGAVEIPGATPLKMPNIDDLIAAALPRVETHEPADVVETMSSKAQPEAKPHIPSSLAIEDDEVEAFEAEEAARRDEEERVTAEYTAAAADAELRAKMLAEEAVAQDRDRAYGKWASEFVGDAETHVDVDTRARIVDDLLTFGDEGREILQRIVSEDPVFAQRAKELLAQVA